MSNRFRPRYTEAELREAIAASRSISDVLRWFGLRTAGGNHRTIKRHAEAWGISMDHFDPRAAQGAGRRRRATPLDEILVEGSSYARGALKRRLYREGLKQRRCEMCGLGEEWRGRPMSLILDHINGVATDNRLENLRIVCANCAATLETHCGRNTPPGRPRCVQCGERFDAQPRQRYCSHRCAGLAHADHAPRPETRKVERPSYEQLLRDLRQMNYLAVGRKYGVSDNAVRKWMRWYERDRSDEAA